MQDDLNQASVSLAEGDVAHAESLVRTALQAAPQSAAGRTLLGHILVRKGDPLGAETEFRAVLQAAPQTEPVWLAWATLLQDAGQPEQAAACLLRGVSYLPDSYALHNDLGLVYLRLGRLDQAAAHAARATALAPRNAAAWFNLGVVYGRQGLTGEAAAAFRAAIARDAALAEAHNALGEVLHASDPAGAEAAIRAALAVRPDYAEALDNLGALDVLGGDIPAALAKFDQALALKPSLMRALAHKTTALFLAGRLPEAWSLHKRRFEAAGLRNDPHGRFSQARWNGEPLAGKGLLVWTELGLGEEILQASMFADVLHAGARLMIECSPRLVALFQRSFPAATVLPRVNPTRASAAPIDADYQVAGGDLGGIYRRDVAHFPKHAGYLAPDPALTADLRRKYRQDSAFVVGLSWASTRSALGGTKTMDLAAFAPILRQRGVTFVNLQYGADPAEVAAVEGAIGVRIVTDPAVDPLGDMDAVAAQVAAMDLVICVSNTAAHVAGALNVPVWNVIPGYTASGMWHWFSGSERSPWYPSMKIYRRVQESDAGLMSQIAADLAFVQARGGAA